MENNKHDSADPFQPGDPLEKNNLDKFWFRVMLLLVAFVILFAAGFPFHETHARAEFLSSSLHHKTPASRRFPPRAKMLQHA